MLASGLQHGEQPADLDVVFERVPQMEARLEPVVVLPPDALSFEVASHFEVDDDSLHSSFGDLHSRRDVANAGVGAKRDAVEDVRVIAQERPGGRLQTTGHGDRFSKGSEASFPTLRRPVRGTAQGDSSAASCALRECNSTLRPGSRADGSAN